MDVPEILYCETNDQYVHQSCRMKHTNPKYIKSAEKRRSCDDDRPKERSQTDAFSLKTHCFFCGTVVNQTAAKKYKNDTTQAYSHVMTLDYHTKVLRNDKWGLRVMSRISAISDLPAEEAIYHRTCARSFYNIGSAIPQQYDTETTDDQQKKRKYGRPKSDSKLSAFGHVINYLEHNDDSTITLDELYDAMQSNSDNDDIYSKRQLQRQLLEHYDSRVSITTVRQQANVVTLTSNLKPILQKGHENSKIN